MLKVVDAKVRLRVVQPEPVDAQVVVVLLADLPDVLARLGIEGVDLHAVALVVVGLLGAALGADQQAPLHHGAEVLALAVHGGPDGDDHLDAHLVELVHHGLGVRPVDRVELPVALHGPVEEVDDDLVDVDALGLVLPGDGEHLVLRAVAQLALPKAHAVLREGAGAAGDGGVVLQDLLGVLRGGDPVVHLLGGAGDPLGVVLAEGHLAHGRVVPQEPVAQGRNRKRHRDLRIALRQLQRAALQVQIGLLVLAHAEDLLPVVALELDVQLVLRPADDALPGAVDDLEAPALARERAVIHPVVFAQDLLAVPVEGDDPGEVDDRLDAAVGDGGLFLLVDGAVPDPVVLLLDDDERLPVGDVLRQRPGVLGELALHGGADAQGILAPRLDAGPLPVVVEDQRSLFDRKPHARFSLLLVKSAFF